ncbi:MAG: ribonuclease Z [Dysgonamonadaceae bacterium]|jgi:ribonuclease Z|nr:ribonuclease Z [Dysgonamonadaceae bacterium]MDD3309501.1 ribonuclease Z [Dysgonamonadaceae bacterium]MDD3900821.1 ribonuclease Z [Dysgonamonadaceae bacterium]MDD4398949.1 ribonuclease Z [Dysgonamonadaceae bacterium]MEA5081046.1 ribonuclease Z [Dysgonamonadaceae bacterium]
MNAFEIDILGCGSATPTTLRNPSAQAINLNEKIFLVDCGEGAQLQMRKFSVKMSRLHSIFLSHLHGDHVLGLPGLISTLQLLGRTGDIDLYAHKEIEPWLRHTLNFFCKYLPFEVKIIPLASEGLQILYENKTIRISSFPLNHRVPSNGFLFEEKKGLRHIKKDMIDFYQIPIRDIQGIKEGYDFITNDGETIPNNLLTTPPTPSRSYAYCADTAFCPNIVPFIEGVDVLYHEATFSISDASRARETFHSTTKDAAEIARLSGAKKLIIGHFSSRYTNTLPLLKEAQNIFPNTQTAYDGLKINI